eukprot:GHRQ01034066.1.p2 GENE.GHRQ01034066.1~~GHRQ01034066.1.p2  ORF type:complete len:108 (+),score=21.58 GHRQ01034066.1:78-401(+)
MNCLHSVRPQLQLHCRAASRPQPCCCVSTASSRRLLQVAATALKENPQNTPNPQEVTHSWQLHVGVKGARVAVMLGLAMPLSPAGDAVVGVQPMAGAAGPAGGDQQE